MIIPFYGEMLFAPMGLEVSMNPCSHRCVYCFSRLNGYKRQGTFSTIINALRSQSESYVSKLIQQKYCLCVSNRTDPFSDNNYAETIRLLEILTDMDYDFTIQTKTGRGIDEVLEFIKPCFWYITITTGNDILSKKIEPGCPSAADRFKTIEKLVLNGHSVFVGINPFNHIWVNDKKSFINKIKNSGAYGVVLQELHLNGYMRGRQTPEEKKLTVISKENEKHINEMFDLVRRSGLKTENFMRNGKSDLYAPFEKRYKTMPLLSNFVNWAFDHKQDNEAITFKDFIENLGGVAPVGILPLEQFFFSTAHTTKVPKKGSFKKLLQTVWTNLSVKNNPTNWGNCFSYLIEEDEDDNRYINHVTDDDNMPIMLFSKKGYKTKFVYADGECQE